jgi:hypothetical protein
LRTQLNTRKEQQILSLIYKEAFDTTSLGAMPKGADQHEVESINRSTNFMLESRGTLSGETLEVAATRGCHRGEVLSPLMWSQLVYEFLGSSMSVTIMQ